MSRKSTLHVLHIASGDLWAGGEVQLFMLACALHEVPDVTVTVLLMNDGVLAARLRDRGIEVVIIDEAVSGGLQLFRAMLQALRTLDPDIVHTHRVKENVLGSLAARVGGDLPSLRTVHGAQEHPAAWYRLPVHVIRFLDWLSGRYLQRRIVAVSEELAGQLGRHFPAARICTIENGIMLEGGGGQPAQAGSVDRRRLRIGVAGRLVPVKRIDLVLQTAAVLHAEQADVEFRIYGDGPLRSELESLGRQLDTGDRVRFLGHADDMGQQLRDLDVLLMTSDHEGLPMVLLEAMALRVPVIAHATGGIPVLLAQGECGVLVDDHTPEGYASAIRRLAHDEPLRVALADRAYERVSQHYSARRNAEDYLQQYRLLLGRAAVTG